MSRGRWVTEPRREDFAGTEGWDHAFRFCPLQWIKRYHTPLLDISISLSHTLKNVQDQIFTFFFFLLENVAEERTKKTISMHIMEGGGVVGLSTSFYGRKFTSFPSFLFSITHTGSSTNSTFILKCTSKKRNKRQVKFSSWLKLVKSAYMRRHNLSRLVTNCRFRHWTNCAAKKIIAFRISHIFKQDISSKSQWNEVAWSFFFEEL